ncbi:MAG: DUF2148 domain-containing protein [Dysgonamonadaceae bacterium]|jgi:uncharacterized ferredoxin-like protein|nr:DUF2148 domain-containing protein [Dysgonamonadaceae bacterium]
MIINERSTRHERIMTAVGKMMTAARTAPKAKGADKLEIIAIDNENIKALSDKTKELGIKHGYNFFIRDAENILQAEAILLIGSRKTEQALNCNYCGFPSCTEKPENVPCAIGIADVGIAVGSACATAADLRLDTRVMFSIGYSAMAMNMPEKCHTVLAIAIAASSKNPFFDRK